MRQKRAKSYKKQMNIYVHAFKFREPFQVIVDDEMILMAEKASFNLVKGLKRTIQGEIKPMITQCCMQALYKTKDQNAIDIAKLFERRRCNHPPTDPLTPMECIKSIILPKNQFKYILATQYIELRNQLRSVPGIPLVFLKNSVMIMDSVSNVTLRYANKIEEAKLTGGLNDTKVGIKSNESDEHDEDEGSEKPKKKHKGPKGPNPLSVKKKKEDTASSLSDNIQKNKKTRRKRKHTRSNGDKEEDKEVNSNDEIISEKPENDKSKSNLD